MSADAASDPIVLLLEFPFLDETFQQMVTALQALIAELPCAISASAWQRASHPAVTCYLEGNITDEWMQHLRQNAHLRLQQVLTGNVEVSRLQCMAIHHGASHGAVAPFHYVVRTDVTQGDEEELQRWYDEEHMAMLAAVPGTVRARRLVSLDAGPRYYACYDLLAPEVLVSAEWLKARRTAWSEHVRPRFRNTRREISRKLDLATPSYAPPFTPSAAAGNPVRSG